MFRCPWSVTSACLLGTHKSLFTTLRRSQKLPLGGVSNGLLSQWLRMVSRERGQPQRKPEPHRLTHVPREARHGSFSRPVNTDINPADATKQAAEPLTSSQFMGSSSVIFSPKPTSANRFVLGESVPSVRLPLGQQAEERSQSARTCKSEQSAGVKKHDCHSAGGVTRKFNGLYMLSRRLWTPCPAGLSHYGLLLARARACTGERPGRPPWTSACRPRTRPVAVASCRPTRPSTRRRRPMAAPAVLVCLCTFRGGKRDSSDRNIVDTALREACEELGVTVTENDVWGLLKPLRDRSGMLIAPVLANLGPLESLTFRPNPTEVEEIFTLTVAHLCNPQNQGYTHFRIGDRYSYTLPVFHNAKYRIWGLTAVALNQTLKVIMPV